MTPLRQRMIRELELQRKSQNTIDAYVLAVSQLARHYNRSPDEISYDEVRDFIHHLIVERKLASASVNQKLAGIRFFFRLVMGDPTFDLKVQRKSSGRLPEPLGRSEIERMLEVTSNLKHRAMLMTTYGGGLRVSEVVNLKIGDIHSERMLIHIRHGKRDKDRFTLLSARLLTELREYWRQRQPRNWLFPGQGGNRYTRGSLQAVFYRAKAKSKVSHGQGIHSLRHSFGTHLLEGGVDLVTISRLMGHRNLKTTALYLHVTSKHVQGIRSPLDLLGDQPPSLE